jgi:hypothetical protein
VRPLPTSRLRAALASIAAVAWLALGAAPAAAFERVVETVRLAERVMLSEHGPELVLNGAGVRRRLFVNVYVGALYLLRRQNTAPSVLADEGPKRMLVHVLREEVPSDQLVNAIQEGLVANHSAQELGELDVPVREFRQILGALVVLKKGAIVVLDYLPGTGTRVSVNGQLRGTVVGVAFNRALLRVWLGEHPVDARLKQALLGSL